MKRMSNTHLQNAASNLIQASQDVRTLQEELRRSIDSVKQQTAAKTNELRQKMAVVQRDMRAHMNESGRRLLDAAELQHLQNEMSRIQKEADEKVRDLDQRVHGLDGQVYEFQNLANRLNSMA